MPSTRAPLVSVVVGVRDAGDALPTLESVLTQDVDLELIVVDDGSADRTPERLRDLAARDPRVRHVRQEAGGLTAALIRGCALARGEFVARHDIGDLSHPGRLGAQLGVLAEPGIALASCFAEAVGPQGEYLYTIERPSDPRQATEGLLSRQQGLPHHGTALFRRDAYERVGGYRAAFPVAQDWDLWLRLADVGLLGYAPAVLYTFEVGLASLSALRRADQLRYVELARRCSASRSATGDDAEALAAGPPASAHLGAPTASPAYFIGKCLLERRDRRALRYLRQAVRERPTWPRAWLALTLAAATCRDRRPR